MSNHPKVSELFNDVVPSLSFGGGNPGADEPLLKKPRTEDPM